MLFQVFLDLPHIHLHLRFQSINIFGRHLLLFIFRTCPHHFNLLCLIIYMTFCFLLLWYKSFYFLFFSLVLILWLLISKVHLIKKFYGQYLKSYVSTPYSIIYLHDCAVDLSFCFGKGVTTLQNRMQQNYCISAFTVFLSYDQTWWILDTKHLNSTVLILDKSYIIILYIINTFYKYKFLNS